MHPLIELVPAHGAALLAVALATSLFGAWVWRRGRSESVRPFGLFLAYLGALAALGLGLALALGRTLVVGSYSVALAAGALMAWAILFRRLPRLGYPRRLVFLIVAGCLPVGLLGARLAHYAGEALAGGAERFSGVVAADAAGLGVFGALAADTAYVAWLLRRPPGYSLGLTLDAGCSAIALNMAIGRIGCWLNGCCYGTLADPSHPLAVASSTFAPLSPVALHHGTSADVAVWPTQLFEAAGLLLLALASEALFRARGRLRARPGTIALLALASYGLLRAVLETLRADSPALLGRWSMWRIVATLTFVAACSALLSRRGFAKREPAEPGR